MVFSSFLGASADRASSKTPPPRPMSSCSTNLTNPSPVAIGGPSDSESPLTSTSTTANTPLLPEFIFDETQLPAQDAEPPDLRELNNALDALSAIFPDIQVEVFREMLSSFDGESRLAIIADALLKSRTTWVKGRWRTQEADPPPATDDAIQKPDGDGTPDKTHPHNVIPRKEAFRCPEYKKAAKSLAWHEFRGLPRSTINAVLAESNYSYLDARRTLVTLSSKSWRFTVSSFLLRRKPVTSTEAETHPLVVWKSSGRGSILPTIKSTGNVELDRELFDALVVPLKRRLRTSQEKQDRQLAKNINTQEAEAAESTHECACCFSDVAFEEFTSCSAFGHMVCFRCVQHALSEAVFGQGWTSSIDTAAGTLRCLAIGAEECSGRIPSDHLHRAMVEADNGAGILHKLDQRLAEHSLLGTGAPLVRCPFCDYAEVDDLYMPPGTTQLHVRADGIFTMFFTIICVGFIPFVFSFITVATLICLVLSIKTTTATFVRSEWMAALARRHRRRRGLKFLCQNPRCGKSSCMSCGKSWLDVHVCNESSLVSLRTQVEQAMSMAIKRVCPRCNTSFVKTAGCNKLMCPCGYKMCYVCRKDIGEEGYRHFCDHFRPNGDPRACTECDRCNLWESDDTEALLRSAKEEAERKWREAEKRDLSGAERAFVETGIATGQTVVNVDGFISLRRLPTVGEVLDLVIETVFT